MENNELQHWGIKGMKWGVRRYQNSDGTLTAAGKKRYAREDLENDTKIEETAEKASMASLRLTKKIREKVEMDTSNPQYIETIWGVGYRFKM